MSGSSRSPSQVTARSCSKDLDDLRTTPASDAVRLLPGRDPWVMAPGTSDARVVPPARREAVSRSANLVIARGVVSGTWTLRGERLAVAWFKEAGRVPRAAVDQQATALRSLLDRPLDVAVQVGWVPKNTGGMTRTRTAATIASLLESVQANEEVVPVNVSTWVLLFGATVGR